MMYIHFLLSAHQTKYLPTLQVSSYSVVSLLLQLRQELLEAYNCCDNRSFTDEWNMNMEHWWKDRDRVNLNYCTQSKTTNSTFIGLEYNPGLRGGRPDNNLLIGVIPLCYVNQLKVNSIQSEQNKYFIIKLQIWQHVSAH